MKWGAACWVFCAIMATFGVADSAAYLLHHPVDPTGAYVDCMGALIIGKAAVDAASYWGRRKRHAKDRS